MWQTRLKQYEATLGVSPKDPTALEVSYKTLETIVLWSVCGRLIIFMLLLREDYSADFFFFALTRNS